MPKASNLRLVKYVRYKVKAFQSKISSLACTGAGGLPEIQYLGCWEYRQQLNHWLRVIPGLF
jgi:hypothetical protein